MDAKTGITDDDFAEIFGGFTVTLMAARPLRRELALLHAALRPSDDAFLPRRPPHREEVWTWAAYLAEHLPASAPGTPDALRLALAPRPWKGIAPERSVLRSAYRMIRRMEQQSALFLVPAAWSLRMEQLLAGRCYPATVQSCTWPCWIDQP